MRWMVLLLGVPPRCDPTCGQREGAVSLAVGENTDEDEFSSAGAGGWRTVPSTPSVKRCSSSPGARIRRVCGWRASPPLKGGSGAVLPAQRAQRSRGLRGRETSLLRPCGAAPLRGASGPVRPEAGSDSFFLSFEQCESHIARSHRVNVTVLEDTHGVHGDMNSCGSVHGGVMHDNSSGLHVNSCGALGHKNSCHVHAAEVRWGTKAPSTSTRFGVRCPAVEELASPQQTSSKLHVEVWEGLLSNQGMRFSQEEEIVPGCVVSGARPSCLDDPPEPPGPGRIIRNMFGWSQLEKTVRSGVWLFRGALRGENLFFFPLRSRRLG